jgi:FdhE protein
MSPTATIRILPAEEIAARAGGSTPFLRLPSRDTMFAERSMRWRQLAGGHAMEAFLGFMAELAQAQHAALQRVAAVPLPDAAALDAAARAGRPPLPASDWPRHPAWHAAARQIAQTLQPHAPPAGRAALDALQQADAAWFEQQADALLTGVMQGLEMVTAPVVAAALQVHWTHLVLTLQDGAAAAQAAPFGRTDDALLCPACGSRPTASMTVSGGEAGGQRYLHCSLCSLQWHLPRIRCAHCGSDKHIAYQSLDTADANDGDGAGRAAQAAVQAETCDDCGHYLKIFHSDRDPFVDPVADDLASVTLDLLVSEAGFTRHGVNLLLLYGEPEPGSG